MIRAWTTCTVAILSLGCQSGEEPVRGAHRGVDPTAVYRPRPGPAEEPVETPRPEPRDPQFIVVGTTEEEQERDLGAELEAAVGSPTDCVRDFVAAGPTTIRISVSGIVRPTGMIIEPSAYGTGLSAAALECIETRVGLVVLKPLDDTVSKTASAVIDINYRPPVVVESDVGVPEPNLKNVVHPLPKKPTLPRTGIPINDPYWGWLQGGNVRPIEGTKPRKIVGPKPRAIDGYEVDENAQEWD